jgi:hypothetical protein
LHKEADIEEPIESLKESIRNSETIQEQKEVEKIEAKSSKDEEEPTKSLKDKVNDEKSDKIPES